MKKIKIGLFIDNFFPNIDGVVTVVDNYAKRLSKYADVIVVAPDYRNSKREDKKFPYKIIRIKSLKVPVLNYNFAVPYIDLKIDEKFLNEKFDIIHIHSPFSIGKLGIEIAKENKIPVVATMHSQFKRDFLRFVKSNSVASLLTKNLMRVYNECDECWAVNEKMAELFVNYGYKSKPIIMPNATDFELIEDDIVSNEIVNQKYNLSPSENVLLYVGRINILKNILFIADVLRELKKRNYSFKMLFVGDGSDLSTLRGKIDEYNLKNDVIFCGEVKDRNLLKCIYRRSKLFIFPSLYDASSIVQIEAASQKIPTIFLEGSITSSTIKNDINGFVASNDVKSYSKKIISITSNKELYSNVSEHTYKQVYKSYDKIVRNVYKRYIQLIKNNRK